MPAPAVIPAPIAYMNPIAYINAAAVKKLVVGTRVGQCTVAPLVDFGSGHVHGGGSTPCAKLSALTDRSGSL